MDSFFENKLFLRKNVPFVLSLSYIIYMKEKNKKERKSLRRQQRAYDRMAKQWLRENRLLFVFDPRACANGGDSDPIEAIRAILNHTDQIPYASARSIRLGRATVGAYLLFGMKKKSCRRYGQRGFSKDMA